MSNLSCSVWHHEQQENYTELYVKALKRYRDDNTPDNLYYVNLYKKKCEFFCVNTREIESKFSDGYYDDVVCPECGEELVFMTSCYDKEDNFLFELYKCDKCHSDWKVKHSKHSKYGLDKPERYFFG